MGFKLFTSTEFKVGQNEEVELKVPIELEHEKRGVIHGTVTKDCKPANDCLVKLFKKIDGKFIGIGFTFTDCFGQFLFPVCDTDVFLVIKVFCLDEKKRFIKLESACPNEEECEENKPGNCK